MAYYSYETVRDLIPEDFQVAYADYNDNVYYKGNKQYSYDGDPAYDGDFYCMIATYIKYLKYGSQYDCDYDFFLDHFEG